MTKHLILMGHELAWGLTCLLTCLTGVGGQLTRVRDDVTGDAAEAGGQSRVANVGNKFRFIIYNKL